MVGDGEFQNPAFHESHEHGALTSALRDLEHTPPSQARAQEFRHLLSEMESQRTDLEEQNEKLRAMNVALAQSQARYADLYDFAPVAYLRLDDATRIVEANLTAATLFGAERGKLMDRPLSALVAPEFRPALLAHVRACFGERIRVTDEIEISARGAATVAVQITSTPVLDEDGRVVACKTILTDVSELKRAEAVLRFLAQSGTKLASSFDYASNISDVIEAAVPTMSDIAIADVFDRTGELRRIQVAVADPKYNRLARAARQVSPKHGRGTPIDQVVHSREPLLLNDCQATTFRAPDGRLVHEAFVLACLPRSLLYVPIVSHGKALGVLTFMATDSWLRFRAQDAGSAADLASRIGLAIDNARLYDEATRATKMREQVLSLVSHDLKNPLMGILLSTELLLKQAPAQERRRGWKHLDRIRRGVQQMRHMVEDLLDASSIDAGRLAVAVAPRPIAEVVEEALELLRPIATDKEIALKVDLPEPALELRCDRHRLIQVLYNLIGNALKFTPRAGQVTVSAARSGQDLLLTVQDDGPGLPPQLVPRLFQAYAQGEGTARQGRGLGLFISRGIVEAHGGRIWADAQPDRGAKFQFTIPLASPGQVASLSSEMRASQATGDLPSAVAGSE